MTGIEIEFTPVHYNSTGDIRWCDAYYWKEGNAMWTVIGILWQQRSGPGKWTNWWSFKPRPNTGLDGGYGSKVPGCPARSLKAAKAAVQAGAAKHLKVPE